MEKKLATLKHQDTELAQEIAQQDQIISETKEEFAGLNFEFFVFITLCFTLFHLVTILLTLTKYS